MYRKVHWKGGQRPAVSRYLWRKAIRSSRRYNMRNLSFQQAMRRMTLQIGRARAVGRMENRIHRMVLERTSYKKLLKNWI